MAGRGKPGVCRLPLSLALAWCLLHPGCRGAERGVEATVNTLPLGHREVAEIRTTTTCEATGGKWQAGLLACLCPEGRVFSTTKGCRPIRDYAASSPFGCARVGSLVIVDANCPRARTEREARLAHLLRGATVEGPGARTGDVMLKFGLLDKRSIGKDLARLEYGPTNALAGTYPADAEILAEFTREADVTACEALLGTLEEASGGIPAHICEILMKANEAVSSPAFPASAVRKKHAGTGDNGIEFWVTNLGPEFGNALYRVVGKSGLPAVRSLTVKLGERLQLETLLSPCGNLIGGRVRQHLLAPESSAAAVRRVSLYYGPGFQSLEREEAFFGDRPGLVRALQALRQSHAGKHPKGMLLERAVDPRVTSVFHRFQTTISLAEVPGGLADSVFGAPISDDVDATLDLVDCYSHGHGSAVASVLALGAPDAALSLFPLRAGGWLSSVDEGRRLLRDALHREQPRVVNISQGFEEDIADCRGFFGPIFDEFANTTLFVVAAANNGDRNAADVCPGSLGAFYGNVVSVAGVDDSGLIHPASNYGRDVVQVAAPFCTPVLGGGESPAAPAASDCGTSFSAPLVASAALRAIAAAPDLSAAELKQLLLLSCTAQDLDVECGGALDVEAFEENVKRFGRNAAGRAMLPANVKGWSVEGMQ